MNKFAIIFGMIALFAGCSDFKIGPSVNKDSTVVADTLLKDSVITDSLKTDTTVVDSASSIDSTK